ncbi:hypothetical protein BD408DRAFT_424717 [Parasitella parasitica]|nr:hypothetical protein BD408DRAFT_424717 [Parasitella parasitica]
MGSNNMGIQAQHHILHQDDDWGQPRAVASDRHARQMKTSKVQSYYFKLSKYIFLQI